MSAGYVDAYLNSPGGEAEARPTSPRQARRRAAAAGLRVRQLLGRLAATRRAAFTLTAFAAFTAAGWTVAPALGWVVAGACLLILELLTGKETS